MNSPQPRVPGRGALDGQRIPTHSLRRVGASNIAAIMAIVASATAYAVIAQAEIAAPSSHQCAAARKALGKEERALAKTESRIVRATKLLESCGSQPMCDGYQQELTMLEVHKPKLEATVDQRKVAVDRSCAETPADVEK